MDESDFDVVESIEEDAPSTEIAAAVEDLVTASEESVKETSEEHSANADNNSVEMPKASEGSTCVPPSETPSEEAVAEALAPQAENEDFSDLKVVDELDDSDLSSSAALPSEGPPAIPEVQESSRLVSDDKADEINADSNEAKVTDQVLDNPKVEEISAGNGVTDKDKEVLRPLEDLAEDSSELMDLETALATYGKQVTDRPMELSCAMCGGHITSMRFWVCHHFDKKHKKIVKMLTDFRSKCIENCDIETKSDRQDLANSLKDKLMYSQELFEISDASTGDTVLYCGACCVEVKDMSAHVTSLKHNIAYLNVLFPKQFIDVKLASLETGPLKVTTYERNVLQFLAKEMPKTEDAALEIVVLRSDGDLADWARQFVAEFAQASAKEPVERKVVGKATPAKAAAVSASEPLAAAVASEAVPNKSTSTPLSASSNNSACGTKTSMEAISSAIPETSPTPPPKEQRPPKASAAKVTPRPEIASPYPAKCVDPHEERITEVVPEKPEPPISAESPKTCSTCHAKFSSQDAWDKHLASADHAKKVAWNAFIQRKDVYSIVSEVSTMQSEVAGHKPAVIGAECIYDCRTVGETQHLNFWVCGLCNTASKTMQSCVQHLASIKHSINYVNTFHESLRPKFVDAKQFIDAVQALVGKIVANTGVGKLKVAILKPGEEAGKVIAEIMKPSDVTQASSSPPPSSLSPAAKPAAPMEAAEKTSLGGATKLLTPPPAKPASEPQKLCTTASTPPVAVEPDIPSDPAAAKPQFVEIPGGQKLLWCEACYLIICVDTTRWSVESAWDQHVRRPYHAKKWQTRKSIQLDESGFVDETSPSQSFVEQQRALGHTIVGMDDVVDRIEIGENGQEKRSLLCQLCCETFARSDLIKHSANRIHLYQFIHRHFPQNVKELFFESSQSSAVVADRDALVSKFIAAQPNLPIGRIKVHRPPKLPVEKLVVIDDASDDIEIVFETPKPASVEKAKEATKPKSKEPVKQASANETTKKAPQATSDKSHVTSGGKEPQREAAKKNAAPGGNAYAKKNVYVHIPAASAGKASSNAAAYGGRAAPGGTGYQSSGWTKFQQQSQRSAGATEPLQDPLLHLLTTAIAIPFGYGEHAYVHDRLSQCKDPLIGLDQLHEVRCIDSTYEPAYLCKICVARAAPGEVIGHVVSPDHRMKYLELKYKQYYQSVLQRYTSAAARVGVIDQYAGMIERLEGRKPPMLLKTAVDQRGLKSKKKPLLSASGAASQPTAHLMTSSPANQIASKQSRGRSRSKSPRGGRSPKRARGASPARRGVAPANQRSRSRSRGDRRRATRDRSDRSRSPRRGDLPGSGQRRGSRDFGPEGRGGNDRAFGGRSQQPAGSGNQFEPALQKPASDLMRDMPHTYQDPFSNPSPVPPPKVPAQGPSAKLPLLKQAPVPQQQPPKALLREPIQQQQQQDPAEIAQVKALLESLQMPGAPMHEAYGSTPYQQQQPQQRQQVAQAGPGSYSQLRPATGPGGYPQPGSFQQAVQPGPGPYQQTVRMGPGSFQQAGQNAGAASQGSAGQEANSLELQLMQLLHEERERKKRQDDVIRMLQGHLSESETQAQVYDYSHAAQGQSVGGGRDPISSSGSRQQFLPPQQPASSGDGGRLGGWQQQGPPAARSSRFEAMPGERGGAAEASSGWAKNALAGWGPGEPPRALPQGPSGGADQRVGEQSRMSQLMAQFSDPMSQLGQAGAGRQGLLQAPAAPPPPNQQQQFPDFTGGFFIPKLTNYRF